MLDLRKLNPPQREAVTTTEGPLLVLAGAGSGKTRVIVHRIAYLLEQRISPEHILAVTFTNKAAGEMRERVGKLTSKKEAKALTVSTFHAFGAELLRQEIGALGYPKHFSIADMGDQISLVKRAMKAVKIDDRSFDPRRVLALISRAKNVGKPPQPLPEGRGDDYDLIAAEVYPRYELSLKATATVDFDDLLCLPLRLFSEKPEILAKYQERYRYLLVDEYQDTSAVQLQLLVRLAGERRNVCAVGDDDQSIYSWRGAEVKNILQFDRYFPGTKEVRLEQNYRSTGHILAAANAVIAKNAERKPKALWTDQGGGEKVKVVLAENEEEEARYIASTLATLIAEGRRPEHFAVLFRLNAQSRPVEEMLREKGIPYEMVGGSEFFERREVKDLIAYLKVCAHPEDEVSLLRIVNVPPRGIGDTTLERIGQHAAREGIPVREAMRRVQSYEDLPAASVKSLHDFLDMIDRYRRRFQGEPLDQVASALVSEIDLRSQARASVISGAAGMRKVEAIDSMLASLGSYGQRDSKPSLQRYLQRLALDGREEEAEGASQAVTLLTLHAAKGLEFPVVFFAGMEEEIVPHKGMQGEAQNLEEERRLAYVGITRAREQLHLTRAKDRVKRGKVLPRTPSRFLSDIPDEVVEQVDTSAPASPPETGERSFFAELRAKLASQG